jgi:uncharacterized protein with HEPN domain
MKDESLAPLHDILTAGSAVRLFVSGRSFEDYTTDDLLRSAVERKFEIIGEALNRVRRDDPVVLDRIREHRSVISFRNILVHGYDTIDDRIVWSVIQDGLPRLLDDVQQLLR